MKDDKKCNPSTLSVVMSVYNGERFLKSAIESILNQTFEDFEFIIVNDGSTDQTEIMLNSYSDKRIKIIRQQNTGLTKALNTGLSIARGQFVARMDADDLCSNDRFDKQISILKNNPNVGIVGTFARYIDLAGKDLGFTLFPIDSLDVNKYLREKGNCFVHGSMMMRRQALIDIGFYDEFFKYAQDYDMLLRMITKFKVVNIPKYLYSLRIQTDSITNKNYKSQCVYAKLAKLRFSQKVLGNQIDLGKKYSELLQCEKHISSRQMLSNLYSAWATNYYEKGNYQLSRERFIKSILIYPLNFRAFIFAIVTFFPTNLVRMFRSFYHEVIRGK